MSITRNKRDVASKAEVPFDYSVMLEALFLNMEGELSSRHYGNAFNLLKNIISGIEESKYAGAPFGQDQKERMLNAFRVMENASERSRRQDDVVKAAKAEYFYRTNNKNAAKVMLRGIHHRFYANEEGIEALERIEKLNPKDWDIYLLHGQWLQQVGRIEDSRVPLQVVLNANESSDSQKIHAQLFMNLLESKTKKIDVGMLVKLGIASQRAAFYYHEEKRDEKRDEKRMEKKR